MTETIIIALGGIAILSLLCQWLAWQSRLPAILFLLIAGILIGPVLGWLHPAKLFGHLLTPIIEISIAIILFEGSLSLNFKTIKQHSQVVGTLLTLGLLITCVSTTFLAHFLFHLPYSIAILFAVIICVSGPTVVIPMLRAVNLTSNVGNILRWEGIVIDPIGALLAVLVFNFINVYDIHHSLPTALALFCLKILVSGAIGIGTGYFCGIVLRKQWLPEYLHNVGVLAFVLLAFALGNYFEDSSGLLSVTLMGVMVANMDEVHIEDILGFKENLSILLISFTFLVLAASIKFTHLHEILLPGLILVAVLQFVIRPLSVFLCTLHSKLSIKEKIFLGWIYPRGIVAAAISAIFALRLENNHIAGAQFLVIITFFVIISTVVFQSFTIRPLAKLLTLSTGTIQGFLIIGANPLARCIGKALQTHGFNVQLCSTEWGNIQTSRMEGIPAFYGNPVSEYADRNLDLLGLGGLLCLTAQPYLNTLAAVRFRREFGPENIYCVQTQINEDEKNDKRSAHKRLKNASLFADDMIYRKLNSMIKNGAETKTTLLTDVFSYDAFIAANPDNIALFALDNKQHIHFFSPEMSFTPEADWSIVSLGLARKDSHKED